MVFGNPKTLAIESSITEPYEQLSQLALGYFVIVVGDKSFGVKAPDATLLSCSYYAVKERLERRGTHSVSFESDSDPIKIVDAYLASVYQDNRQNETFFGLSSNDFSEEIHSKNIVWAPDGDQAFDDGSHVLQFDIGNKVRLIAFKNEGKLEEVIPTMSETWLSSDEYYSTLQEWLKAFDTEREKALAR
ncbi:Imm42 family immunity protein [Chitinimonas sp. BJB300]|uniref:Imm42 family immunity protein n=1 Tax=Chitinimonas sp. BJB300 TaxID=1559339 RepID=UPI0013047ACE|nr:Imm42 family immunity protein [Chitinimonas sp. BJB300]